MYLLYILSCTQALLLFVNEWSINKALCVYIFIEQTHKEDINYNWNLHYKNFYQEKATFYMCNYFNNSQGICYLFSPTQTYAQLAGMAVLSENFHMRKCWILPYFYIWKSENVSFKQLHWHNEQWRRMPTTESKILSQHLKASLLLIPY